MLFPVTRDQWEQEVVGKFHIMGRMAEVAEIASVALFLFSKDAMFVNG